MNVLFVCRQNAGRSQMAQALYEQRGGNARSAGTTPAEHVHPEVAQLMPKLVDRVPKKLDQADAEWADIVVTMGCGDACPVIPGKKYVDWELQDPADRTSRSCARSGTRSIAASPNYRCSYPAEIRATPARVRTIPASWERATFSLSTSRASATVTIGKRDASTEVTLTSPLVDAAAYRRLPSMSPVPIRASTGN